MGPIVVILLIPLHNNSILFEFLCMPIVQGYVKY